MLLGAVLVTSVDVLISKPSGFVVGKFHAGIKAIDDGTAYGALADIQKVKHTTSRVTDSVLMPFVKLKKSKEA